MCNLSQGIREKGIAEGIAEGKAAGIAEGKAKGIAEGIATGIAEAKAKLILNMHKKGYTLEQIAEIVEKSVEEIEAIIEEKGAVVS